MTVKPQTLLVPVDGSSNAERAVDRAIELAGMGLVKDVHLLNVQLPLPSAVTTFVKKRAVAGYHHDEGVKALATARAKLEAAGVPHELHIGVGQPGETIVEFCKELQCDIILMGTRGHTGAIGVLLGSVTRDVIHKAEVPVTLVK